MISKGSIAERGTHDELLSKGGVYKKLVMRQLNAANQKDGIANGLDGGLKNIQQEDDEELGEDFEDLD